VFAFAPLNVGSATMPAKPAMPGSLQILSTHLAAMTPVSFIPL
jgi:hypothetical protein